MVELAIDDANEQPDVVDTILESFRDSCDRVPELFDTVFNSMDFVRKEAFFYPYETVSVDKPDGYFMFKFLKPSGLFVIFEGFSANERMCR